MQSRFIPAFFLSLLLAAVIGTGCTGTEKPGTADTAAVASGPAGDTSAAQTATAGTTDTAGTVGTTDSTAIPLRTPDGKPARFAFRSGSIEMRYTGDFRGVRRLMFDDYGMREWQYDSAVPAQRVMAAVPPYQFSILTPEYYGGVDLRTGKGQKAPNAAYERYLASPELSQKPFGEIALERSGGERLPDTTLLGKYRCRVYRRSYPNFTQTMWVWGGIPIMEKMRVGKEVAGNYLLEPVEIITGTDVPDSIFTFPERYRITTVAPPPAE